MKKSNQATCPGHAVLLLSSTLTVAVLGCFSAQAIETIQPSSQAAPQLLALELNDRADLEEGSFQCVNNGDPICGNPVLHTSPWTLAEEGDFFTTDGFRGQYYESIEDGTGPTAEQQTTLRQALDEFNNE
jgi:hypothetical protein